MEYIKQLNLFARFSMETSILSPAAGWLYFRLFMRANRFGWKQEWLSVSNEILMGETGIGSAHTLIAARKELKESGFIDFIPGSNHRPTKYKLIVLYQQAGDESNFRADMYGNGYGASANRADMHENMHENMHESMPECEIKAGNHADMHEKVHELNGCRAGNSAGNRADVHEKVHTLKDKRLIDERQYGVTPMQKKERSLYEEQYAAAALVGEEKNLEKGSHEETMQNIIPLPQVQETIPASVSPKSTEKQVESPQMDAPDRWGEVLDVYQQIRPVHSVIEQDKLLELVDTYTAEWVIEAVKEAIYSGGNSIRYVESILRRWKQEGYKSAFERGNGTNGYGYTGYAKCSGRAGNYAGGVAKKARSHRVEPDSIDWSKEPDDWV